MDKSKPNLFDTLKLIDLKKWQAYNTTEGEQQLDFVPFVIQRWLSGTGNASQIMALNEVVNPYTFYFTLKDHQHKQLLFMLMTACTTGKSQKYTWSIPKKKEGSKPHSNKVLRMVYRYSVAQAEEALKLLGCDDIIEMAEQNGYQRDEVALIKREWK